MAVLCVIFVLLAVMNFNNWRHQPDLGSMLWGLVDVCVALYLLWEML